MASQGGRYHHFQLGFVDRNSVASISVKMPSDRFSSGCSLFFSFNPIFAVPVPESYVPSSNDLTPKRKTGRQTGTGSANVASPNQALRRTIPISGFCQVSLLSAISATGRVPPFRDGQPSESL